MIIVQYHLLYGSVITEPYLISDDFVRLILSSFSVGLVPDTSIRRDFHGSWIYMSEWSYVGLHNVKGLPGLIT